MLGIKFFIMMYSLYILLVLNNFILVGDFLEREEIMIEEFKKINGIGVLIKFKDILVYMIINGYIENIVDEEYCMIGGDVLDNIFEYFESVMN